MSNSSVNTVLPNPNTPLAFLPPELANQLEAIRYMVVATLGASVSVNNFVIFAEVTWFTGFYLEHTHSCGHPLQTPVSKSDNFGNSGLFCVNVCVFIDYYATYMLKTYL